MTALLSEMNRVLSSWKADFDFEDKIPLQFTSDSPTQFYFNNLPFHVTDTPVLQSADYDAENIRFYFDRGRTFFIGVEWPEESWPQLSSVAFLSSESPSS